LAKRWKLKPLGYIRTTKYGTAHIPSIVRRELGHAREIPFIIIGHCVLLVDPRRSPEEIIQSLDVLKQDLKLRWGVVEEEGK